LPPNAGIRSRGIGEQAGIEPARVVQAAETLDARGTPAPIRRSLGVAMGMSRVVQLPRAPTDREWEQLVSQFRTTFGTPGRTTTSGGLREWFHGGMHIAVEPTAHGEQLRLTTRNGAAEGLNALGLLTGGMSLLMSVIVAAAGRPEKALAVFGVFGGMALASFGANLIRSPRWAREKTRELEAIAEEAVELLSNP
jgi:hypothetical protein